MPVTVIVYVPATADDDVDTVIVELDPEFTDDGLNDTLTPLGAPDADNDTDSALPDVTAVLTEAVVELPAVTEPEAGDNETEKSLLAWAFTVNE